jgi:hypothetical protein
MLQVYLPIMIVNISGDVDYHARQIYLKHAQPQAILTIMLGKST